MRIVGQIKLANVALFRATLMLAFLILSSLQPSLATRVNAATYHGAMVMDAGSVSDVYQASPMHVHAEQSVADERGPTNKHDHHGKSLADKECEVHCAPLTAVAVECPFIQQPNVRCYSPSVISAYFDGEYSEFARPPRYLN